MAADRDGTGPGEREDSAAGRGSDSPRRRDRDNTSPTRSADDWDADAWDADDWDYLGPDDHTPLADRATGFEERAPTDPDAHSAWPPGETSAPDDTTTRRRRHDVVADDSTVIADTVPRHERPTSESPRGEPADPERRSATGFEEVTTDEQRSTPASPWDRWKARGERRGGEQRAPWQATRHRDDSDTPTSRRESGTSTPRHRHARYESAPKGRRDADTTSEIIELGESDVLPASGDASPQAGGEYESRGTSGAQEPSDAEWILGSDDISIIEEVDALRADAQQAPEANVVEDSAIDISRPTPSIRRRTGPPPSKDEIIPTTIYRSGESDAVDAPHTPPSAVAVPDDAYPSDIESDVTNVSAERPAVESGVESGVEAVPIEEVSGAQPLDDTGVATGVTSGINRLARRRLASLLDRLEASQPGESLGRYTRRIVRELAPELRRRVDASDATDTDVAADIHELAAMLRQSSGIDAGLPDELDRLAAELDPELVPAHHALAASALKNRHFDAYVEELRALARHAEAQLDARGETHGQVSSVYSSILVELGVIAELVHEEPGPAVASLAQGARAHSAGYPLAAFDALRRAQADGEASRVDTTLTEMVRLSSSPLQSALALELVQHVLYARENPGRAATLAAEHLSHATEGGYPYALQLLAWRMDAPELELDVTRAQLSRLVSAGKQPNKQGRRRALKIRIAGLFLRVAQLLRAKGDPAGAARALADAVKVAPQNLIALRAAVRDALVRGDHETSDRLLEELFDRVADPAHRAAIAHRRAELALHAGGNANRARSHLLESLEASPHYLPAAVELGRMFLKEQQFEPLLELWSSLVDTEPGASPRWTADADAHRRGEILETLLADPDQAFDAYAGAFAQRPTDRVLTNAVMRTGFYAGRFEELAALLLDAEPEQEDRVRRADMAWVAAQIYERELDDHENAIRGWLRFLELDPTHLVALKRLIRLYRRGGYWREAIALLEQIVELETNAVELRILREWLGYLRAHLGDEAEESALSVLDALLEESPDSLTAQSLLRSTLLAARDWNGLEQLCLRLARRVEPRRQRDLLLQAAHIARAQLNDNVRARTHLEAARKIDTTYKPLLDMLEEVYAEEGDDEALVELLTARADATAPPERTELLVRAAELTVDVLDDPERATGLYFEAVEDHPEHPQAWRGLEQLLVAQSQWGALADVLRRRLELTAERETRLALLRELAWIQGEMLEDWPGAREALEELLAIAPDDLFGLLDLAHLAGRASDADAAIEAHERIADIVLDEQDRVAHLLRAVELHVDAHNRVPFDLLERVLEIDPAQARARRLIAELRVGREDRPRLIALLTKLEPASGTPQRALEVARLARLLEEAQRLEEARERYERVIELCPDFVPAQLGLIRVLDGLGADLATARRCEALATRVGDEALRLPLLRTAADRYRRADRGEDMAAVLERILRLAPDDEETFATVRAYHQRVGNIDRLAALLADRTDPASVEARVDMLRQLTDIDHVEPGNTAYRSALEELAELSPDDADVLRRLAELDLIEQRPRSAAERFERVLNLRGGPASDAALAERTAELWLEQCRQPRRALALLDALLEAGPAAGSTLRLAARARTGSGDVDGAISLWEQTFRSAEDPDLRVEAGLALGGLYRDAVGDYGRAGRWFVAVGELDPSCEAATEALIQLGSATGQPAPGVTSASTVGLGADQLDKAIDVQLEALQQDPWTIARYEQLTQLLHLRDETDPRVPMLATLLRRFGRLGDDLGPPLAAHEARYEEKVAGGLRIDDASYRRHLLHPNARGGFHELFARLGDALGRLTGPWLRDLGVEEDATPIGFDDPDGILAASQDLAVALGTQPPVVYVVPDNPNAVGVAFAPEPSLGLGATVLGENAPDGDAVRSRFRVGMALEGMRDGKAVAARLGAADIGSAVSHALERLFPDLELRLIWNTAVDTALDGGVTGEHLARTLPRRKRRELRQLAERVASAHWDLDRWCESLTLTCMRAGLLLAGDLGVALDVLCPDFPDDPSSPEGREVLRHQQGLVDVLSFAISDEFVSLIRQCGGTR